MSTVLTELRRRLGLDTAPKPEPDLNTVVCDTIPPETMTNDERVRWLNYHTSNQHGR